MVGEVVLTFPRSCHRQCPTCLELHQPGGLVSECLQAAELYPSSLFQTALWCHKQAAWTLTLSETPGAAVKTEKIRSARYTRETLTRIAAQHNYSLQYLVFGQLDFNLVWLIGDLQLRVQSFLSFF